MRFHFFRILTAIKAFIKKAFDPKSVSSLMLILLFVSASVAILLSGVNLLTRDRIADARYNDTLNALKAVFPANDTFDEDSDTGIFTVYSGTALLGYAVPVTGRGYGGDIELIVGIGTDASVKGIAIVAISETPGFGSKANEETWFLEQFFGKKGSLIYGSGLNAISGATVTSKAVLAAINEALELAGQFIIGGNAE